MRRELNSNISSRASIVPVTASGVRAPGDDFGRVFWGPSPLWGGLALFHAVLALPMIGSSSEPWFKWVLASRLILSLLAVGAMIWRMSRLELPETSATLFLFLSLGVQSMHAVSEGANRSFFLQMAGVMFVVTAALFRSSRRDWLLLFLPLCAALLYVPAFLKKDLAGALSLVTAALVLGQAVSWLRARREGSDAGARELKTTIDEQIELVKRLRRVSLAAQAEGESGTGNRIEDGVMNNTRGPNKLQLVRDLQSPLKALQLLAHSDDEISPTSKKLMDEAIQRIRLIAEQLAVTSTQREMSSEFASVAAMPVPLKDVPLEEPTDSVEGATVSENEPVAGLSQGEGRIYGLSDLVTMLNAVLERKQCQYAQAKKIRLTWARTVDRNLPIAVQINSEDFCNVVASLMDQAVGSLGGGEGVVRLGLHPGLRQIQITVEDNGRGMSEDLLMRLQNRGILGSAAREERLTFKQIKALVSFWGGRVERQARLGVGSRVCVELPRVDAFTTPFAASRNAQLLKRQTNESALL